MAQNTRSTLSKPIIGVTGNNKSFSPSWICIRLAIFLAGGKAKRISTDHLVNSAQLQGLVISGGDDIHPELYGEPIDPNLYYDTARDKLEISYIEYAFANNIPMLGICRGYQLINVVAGGSLYADISKMRKKTSNKNQLLPVKTVDIQADSLLFTCLGNKNHCKVNSLHHQAIKQLGANLKAVATDKDGFIQAIESNQSLAKLNHQNVSQVMGVQWHPEYLWYLKSQRGLFKRLVNQAKQK
ncbi:gamma-glutamyl-gamma-aminobutyrate hydrolase family protein [Catenovulum adriaticum]|uniref:Gamma-glutamyl-gamma-aminobutyrate hydrolase family protein n=1 Tax=Catenovulum adriaticum TaxID=2984846 RepID=A0ABY7ARE3_9ALTE|nr:gamma-glutamyl-gamma-aminobutyrate hydrolase family protein [Catenovulum sp. TS8]WAJ71337.1 gamma-glutamyl-gamma-aminobutyrate hydrolase family protein [Catenovulum sp. TS8]